MQFNPKPSTIMLLDVNSCFATIEQQANPSLRGKPVAVAAYDSPSGCILAASVEAKRFGVKTGMRVKEGKVFCPSLVVLPPDPDKYRNVHLELRKIISSYTSKFSPKSIDEFILDLTGYPACKKGMVYIGKEIKERIKKEIGEWITVSIGIAPNRYLAKVAAGLKKPDGLEEINKDNYLNVFSKLKLTDLTGIKRGNAGRLLSVGINSVLDFYHAPAWKLNAAFHSINSYYWHMRLHGYEVDGIEFARRSYGNSYALPTPLQSIKELSPILTKLVEKTGARLRTAGFSAQGVHLGISFKDGTFWHKGIKIANPIFDSRDIFREELRLLSSSPKRQVRDIAISVFNLMKYEENQLELFEDVKKKKKLVEAIDIINKEWGNFVVAPARMIGTSEAVKDRIGFGQSPLP